MGVEWGLAVEKKRTLHLPLTTLHDYYRKEGYKVTSISLVWEHCGDFDREQSGSRQLEIIKKKFPFAVLSKKSDGTYHYVDKGATPEMEIQLELIEDNKKKRNLESVDNGS